MSFINPLFLFAIGGALIPLIIHLIRKMRAKKVRFSSLMFLRATPKELIKKRRFRDIILLATRMVMLVLLALMFSRPFIPQERIPFVSADESRSVVILLDNSYSMQYGSLMDEARNAAIGTLDGLDQDDEAAVLIFNEEIEHGTELNRNFEIHRNLISAMYRPSFMTTSFYVPLSRAEELLENASNPEREIVIISDFQQAGWQGQLEEWKLSPGITVVPLPVQNETPVNSFVNNFRVRTAREADLNNAEFLTGISTEGSSTRSGEVTLYLNGEQAGRERSESSGLDRVVFQKRGLREGVYQGEVALSDDNLKADNSWYFTLPVEPLPAILCIDDSRGRSSSNAFFLRSAFDLGEVSRFRFETGGQSSIGSSRLSDFRAIILADPGNLSNSARARLIQYVENGGSLIISFGERQSAAGVQTAEMFKIGTIRETVTSGDLQGREALIGEVDIRHPVFSMFSEAGGVDMFRPRFRKYIAIDSADSVSVIGSYDSGDPFLLERKSGRGTVICYTSTFNNQWTDFPVHEIYVPVLYKLAEYAAARETVPLNYLVGESVRLTGQPGAEWQISGPGGEIFKTGINESGEGFFRETYQPGNYTAELNGERFAFSVNLNTRESELRYRDVEEAVAAVTSPPSDDSPERLNAAAVDITAQEKEQKMWLYILIMLLGLFMFENWFANRSIAVKKIREQEQPG